MLKHKIMVIDDDIDILDVVTVLLDHHGYETVAINSGQDLIEKIQEIKPKLILLDVQLGAFDGRILCKQIKEIKEYSGTPIILFSANSNYSKNIREYLCDDFIAKPFEIVSLIEIITKHSGALN